MIYLIRPPDIAAVENEAKAARYEAQGYARVEAWRFIYWWSVRDYADYARLRVADLDDWLARQDLPAPGELVDDSTLAHVMRHRWG